MSKPAIYLKIEDSANIQNSLRYAMSNGYCGVMTSVVNTEYKKEFINESIASKQVCFTRSPLLLDANSWTHQVIPYITPLNLGVNDEELQRNNELQLTQELNFALHLKNYGITVVKLTDNDPEAMAECIKNSLHNQFEGKLVVELPMIDNNTLTSVHCSDIPEDSEEAGEDQWNVWNKFHAATGYNSRIEVALILTADLPTDEELKRWLGEPVALLVIPHSTFVSNSSFFPVLSKKHQEVIWMFGQYTRCSFAIETKGCDDNRLKSYSDFVEHVCLKTLHFNENTGFEDSLRYPLQPLHDNLDTSTYETFERDPTKYILYQRAIEAAIVDKIPENEIATRRLILIVVGAGRGPLVRAAINASKNTGRKLKILVVEKNPNAIVTLTSLISILWPNEDITLISKDMRKLDLEEKADIIVSELLGSIGDNELSPECLDGAQKLLKPDGISIPSNSISYVRPVMASRVHNTILDHKNGGHRSKLYSKPTDLNWLVYLSSVYFIDEPKQLFKFEHPNHEDPIDNSRYEKLEFKAPLDCVLHGFSGYFSSKLYKDIEISILPKTHSPGMASWFSAFFPVSEPCTIKKGEKISVQFWRKVEPSVKVWYEWKVPSGDVANKDGANHPIFL